MIRMNEHKKGQTLIEALITIVLISVGVIALIRFQNYLAYNNSVAQQKAEATVLATKQTETLRDFQVLNNTSGYTSYQSIATGSSTVNGTTATYTITWTVTTTASPAYKNIAVTVSWTDRNNQSNSVQLVSNIAEVDPANSASVT